MRIYKNRSVKELTNFKIGGTVEYLLELKDADELPAAIRHAKKLHLPYFILAGGSNVAFLDGHLKIAVIYIKPSKCRGDLVSISGEKIIADASVVLFDFIQYCMKHNLGGLEKLHGIYGTVGGATVGNAGAFGESFGNHVTQVKIFDGNKTKWLKASDCMFAYRHSIFKEQPWAVIAVELKLEKKPTKKLLETSRETLIKRGKFTKELKCPGSYFKNIEVAKVAGELVDKLDATKIIGGKIPAGYLLDAVGAKGMKVGGISVSDFHGNVIINNGKGTYVELIELTNNLKNLVKERFGIGLEEEVRRVDTTTFSEYNKSNGK